MNKKNSYDDIIASESKKIQTNESLIVNSYYDEGPDHDAKFSTLEDAILERQKQWTFYSDEYGA